MLVLSRKPEEAILIGDDIRIIVLRIGPNSVRLGIAAPGNTNIVREELVVTEDNPRIDLAGRVPEVVDGDVLAFLPGEAAGDVK